MRVPNQAIDCLNWFRDVQVFLVRYGSPLDREAQEEV